MPQGPELIFGIQNENYESWKLDAVGNAFISASPYFMEFSPDGWAQIAVQNVVNNVYKNIDRSVSLPLTYIGDAASIIKEILYNKGTKEKAYLVIGSQELDIQGVNGVLTGGPDLSAGTNLLSLNLPAGQTTYIQITINNPSPGDQVTGNIGSGIMVNFGANNTTAIYQVTTTGINSINLYFHQEPGSASTVTIQLVNASGSSIPTYQYWYKFRYRALIDLTQFSHVGAKVTLNTIEDGLSKFLKANDKTKYTYSMTNPNAEYIKMDGIKLHEKLNYIFVDGIDLGIGVHNGNMLPIFFLNNEGNSSGLSYNSQNGQQVGSNSNPFERGETNNCLFNFGSHPVTINITGTIEIICTKRVASDAQLRLRCAAGLFGSPVADTSQNVQMVPTIAPFEGNTYTYTNVNFNITLNPNEYLFFFDTGQITGTECTYQFTEKSRLFLSFITRQDTTYIKAFPPQFLFRSLINDLTNGAYQVDVSSLFTTHANKKITCGNAIRGIADAEMQISFRDLFNFFDAHFSTGIIEQSNGKINFELEEDLIDLTNEIDIGEPEYGTFRVSMMKDLFFNNIKLGGPELTNEVGVLNGKQEFTTPMNFSSGESISPAELDKSTEISPSPYEMERIRTATLNKDSTDYKSDNKLFAIHTNDLLIPASGDIPAHYTLNRDLNPFVTAGLVEPETVFNLFFTPHRQFIRNGAHIRGRHWLTNIGTFNFTSADQNKDLVCDGIVEIDPVTLASLSAPKLVPIQFDFSTSVSKNVIDFLKANPKQIFKITVDGIVCRGALIKNQPVLANEGVSEVSLRAIANNPWSQLKKYEG